MKQRTLTGLVLALVSFLLLCCFRLPFVPELASICLGQTHQVIITGTFERKLQRILITEQVFHSIDGVVHRVGCRILGHVIGLADVGQLVAH